MSPQQVVEYTNKQTNKQTNNNMRVVMVQVGYVHSVND